MPATPLHYFPPPPNTIPRKSSLKKPRLADAKTVAWHVTTAPVSPKVQPANHLIHHAAVSSLPSSSSGTPTRTYFDRRVRPSPLPEKTRFRAPSPSASQYSSPSSAWSGSPTLVRTNSGATFRSPPSSEYVSPMHSMFPRYDHSKPLEQQHYYPRHSSLPTTLPRAKVSKLESPVERQILKRMDSGVALSDGFEQIPLVDDAALIALWNASSGQNAVDPHKVKITLHQPPNCGTSLAIGTSAPKPLYLMESASSALTPRGPSSSRELSVSKTCPHGKTSMPVAQLVMPSNTAETSPSNPLMTTIVPHRAALDAIEAVTKTPAARAIAHFDPTATSPEAARLAQAAVADAHARHGSDLVRTTRKRDSLGAVTASYQLCHPSLGIFALTVNRAKPRESYLVPKAKISIHHPSATSAAIAAETLVLAALDFAQDACIVDTPGLLALEDPYIIDTALCSLLAIAWIENNMIQSESLTFAPPPTTPLTTKRKSRSETPLSSASSTLPFPASKAATARKWYKPFGKRSKVVEMQEPPEEELPALTQGALALLGLSFKTAVWILGAGVKVTTSVVLGASHLASKA